jgi:PKD repeat protein
MLFFCPLVNASGPKSVYGILYIDGEKAGPGIDVTIQIDNMTFTKKTFNSSTYNYIIGLPPGYEGKNASFFISTDNIQPEDNRSFVINLAIEYIYDLHVENLTQNVQATAIIVRISPNPAAYNQTVQFIGRGTDPDGTIIGYHWRSSLSGNLSTNQSFNLTNMQKGNHTIYFKVKDNSNVWSSEVSQVLRITHYNRLPKATIDTVKPQKSRINKPITFKGHGNDTDGTVIAYAWRSNQSGLLSDKASFNTSGLPKGNHTIYFKVMDNTSYWSEEVHTWVLILENVPPIARISGPSQGMIGVPLQFDGTLSNDTDGLVISWFWEFGDGTNSTSSQPTHTYNEVNTYQIRLTVTDDSQKKSNTTSQIIIAQAELPGDLNQAPQQAVIQGPTKGTMGMNLSFNISAFDPDSEPVFFQIEWGDGQETTTEFTPSNTEIIIEHVWKKAGTYLINITAVDVNYVFSPKTQHELVISEAFLGGLDWFMLVFVIIIICVVVGIIIIILKRRKNTSQSTPGPILLDENLPAETYPEYSDEPLVSPEIPMNQPIQKPSAFKRI